MLFGSYRRGDANDPDAYVASIAAVLSVYDFELMRRVTDPRTGIQTTLKFQSFMPNAGELKVYCDEQAAIAARLERYRALPAPNFNRLPPPKKPGCRANLFVPSSALRYQAMVEAAKTAEVYDYRFDDERAGIWVPVFWYTESAPRPGSAWQHFTADQLRELYARQDQAGAAE